MAGRAKVEPGAAGRRPNRKARPNRNNAGGSVVPRSNAAQPGILKFYDQEAQGIKMTPTQVLVISLVFIALVVLLHIWGKMRGGSKEEESSI